MAFDRRKLLNKARQGVQDAFGKKEAPLIQAVRSLDDIDDAKSLLFQRMDEWFKQNFPEFSAGNDESYAKIVAEFGCKEDLDEAKLAETVGQEKAAKLMDRAKESFGAAFAEEDKKAIKILAARVFDLFVARKELEEYIRTKAEKDLRNVSYLTDPMLATRLLALAGNLVKLAEMPSSTIQVIGAEKSLFKHLRSGSLPPKHGIIFLSPLISAAPLDKRGKIARALAAKIAIAAKADAFTGNFIADKLKATLELRLGAIDKLAHRDIKPKIRDDDRGGFGRSNRFGGGQRPQGGFSKGKFRPNHGGGSGGFRKFNKPGFRK